MSNNEDKKNETMPLELEDLHPAPDQDVDDEVQETVRTELPNEVDDNLSLEELEEILSSLSDDATHVISKPSPFLPAPSTLPQNPLSSADDNKKDDEESSVENDPRQGELNLDLPVPKAPSITPKNVLELEEAETQEVSAPPPTPLEPSNEKVDLSSEKDPPKRVMKNDPLAETQDLPTVSASTEEPPMKPKTTSQTTNNGGSLKSSLGVSFFLLFIFLILFAVFFFNKKITTNEQAEEEVVAEKQNEAEKTVIVDEKKAKELTKQMENTYKVQFGDLFDKRGKMLHSSIEHFNNSRNFSPINRDEKLASFFSGEKTPFFAEECYSPNWNFEVDTSRCNFLLALESPREAVKSVLIKEMMKMRTEKSLPPANQ